jgi:hypothetical protein
MVIPPANTGKANTNMVAVTTIDHTNRGTRSNRRPFHRILIIVVIKLIEAKIDPTPAK